MPTLLSDPPNAFYLILFVLVVIAGGIWFRYRDRGSMVRCAAVAALLLVIFMIDTFVESPREVGIRKVNEMCAAATEPNPDKFVANVSESFEYAGANKQKVRQSGAWEMVKRHEARIVATGFDRDKFNQVSDTEFEQEFLATAKGKDGGVLQRYVRARFVRDSDGQYRLKGVKFFDPMTGGMNHEEPIPGFP
jgi:hypothetical protein